MRYRSKISSLRARQSLYGSTVALMLMAGGASAQSTDAQGTSCPSNVTCTASGANVQQLQPLVDRIIGPVVVNNAVNGAVSGAIVGVSWHGQRTFFGYGIQGTPVLRPDNIVEIGSITKVFTTAMFAESLANNELQIDAPLRTYMAKLGLPTMNWCAQNVTLRQLANFTSGMPLDPRYSNGDKLPAFPNDDISNYTSSDFLAWLSTWAPNYSGNNCTNPLHYFYSNAGIGILGYVVADVHYNNTNNQWLKLVNEEIINPLGMTSTFIDVPNCDKPRVVPGYAYDPSSGQNEQAVAWPKYAWYPAGALRSDAIDMLNFGEAALQHPKINGNITPPALINALQTAMTTDAFEFPAKGGRRIDQGLAWVALPSSSGQATLYVKDGGTSGFSSTIVINPNKDLAIFVAFNQNGVQAQPFGVSLSRSTPD